MSNNVSETQSNDKTGTSTPMLVVRLVIYALIIGAIWFLASWRWDYWMGWAVVGVEVALAFVALIAVPLDAELEAERTQIKEGVKTWDKWIVAVGNIYTTLGMLILAGLDVRFGWSIFALLPLQVAMLVIAVLGRLFSTWASAVNKFYARFVRIQKERGHVPITDGPYRFVRHPGYAGLVVYYIGVGVAFGSRWTLFANVLAVLLMIVRTALEDKTLREELDGYEEYTKQTRYRLLPGIW